MDLRDYQFVYLKAVFVADSCRLKTLASRLRLRVRTCSAKTVEPPDPWLDSIF